jgi:hypothetical protein
MSRSKKQQQPDATEVEKKETMEVTKWLDRIEQSERFRKRIAAKYRWVRLLEEYKGYFQGLTDSTDIYIPALNYMFAYVKSEIPSLYLRDPKIKVNPKNNSTVLAAKILEKAINYIWRTKKIKRENKKNIFDNFMTGHSWFKVGYTGKFGSIEDGNGNTYEFIESEDFFGYRVPTENITFNPDSQDPPYDCRWIAHEVWIPLEDAKENKAYQHTDELVAARPNPEETSTQVSSPSEDINRGDPDTEKCKLYEVWDKKTQMTFTVSPGCHYYIQAPKKWPYKLKGFPFSFLRLNDDPNSPYGIPDCYMFEPQIMELMKIRASELDHLKRFNRQLLVAEGHISNDAMAMFTQAITGATIPVRTDGKPISEIVMPVQYPQMPPDAYAIEDRIKMDIIKISGQSDIDQGAPQKTNTRTMSELQDIQQSGTKRRSEKVDVLQDFVVDIANNYTALLQQLADVPYYVRVSGEDPQAVIDGLKSRPSSDMGDSITSDRGFTFTKEDIKGDFDFEVVPGSMAPLDQQRQWELLTGLAEMAPKAGAIPGGPFIGAIAQKLAELTDMPELIMAMQKEAQMQAEMKQEQEKQAQEQQDALTAQTTGELQIKAEREATRQLDTQIKGIKSAHDVVIKRSEMGGETKAEAPESKVSQSISFKDLPPEGQIQMAAQAGITLTPEQVKQLQENANKIAMAKAKKPEQKNNGV